MATKNGPLTDAALKVREIVSRLVAQVTKLRAEKAELETDSAKAASILETTLKEGQKVLLLLLFVGMTALALYHAPGNKGEGVVNGSLALNKADFDRFAKRSDTKWSEMAQYIGRIEASIVPLDKLGEIVYTLGQKGCSANRRTLAEHQTVSQENAMKYLATAFAVLLYCSPAIAQANTSLEVPPVQILELGQAAPAPDQKTAPATPIPARFSDCSEQCLLQLAKLACISGAEGWTSTDAATMTKGAATLLEFMVKLERNCRVMPVAQAGAGTTDKKAAPPVTRGPPKCSEGAFDATLGMCVRTNVAARPTED